MWDQVYTAMNDFLIMGKNARISKRKPSIPFLSFSPTSSSASIPVVLYPNTTTDKIKAY